MELPHILRFCHFPHRLDVGNSSHIWGGWFPDRFMVYYTLRRNRSLHCRSPSQQALRCPYTAELMPEIMIYSRVSYLFWECSHHQNLNNQVICKMENTHWNLYVENPVHVVLFMVAGPHWCKIKYLLEWIYMCVEMTVFSGECMYSQLEAFLHCWRNHYMKINTGLRHRMTYMTYCSIYIGFVCKTLAWFNFFKSWLTKHRENILLTHI